MPGLGLLDVPDALGGVAAVRRPSSLGREARKRRQGRDVVAELVLERSKQQESLSVLLLFSQRGERAFEQERGLTDAAFGRSI